MTRCDALASLGPRPCGPPLRGRADLREGISRGQQEAARKPPEHGTGYHRFHLKKAGPWSKNGVRLNS